MFELAGGGAHGAEGAGVGGRGRRYRFRFFGVKVDRRVVAQHYLLDPAAAAENRDFRLAGRLDLIAGRRLGDARVEPRAESRLRLRLGNWYGIRYRASPYHRRLLRWRRAWLGFQFRRLSDAPATSPLRVFLGRLLGVVDAFEFELGTVGLDIDVSLVEYDVAVHDVDGDLRAVVLDFPGVVVAIRKTEVLQDVLFLHPGSGDVFEFDVSIRGRGFRWMGLTGRHLNQGLRNRIKALHSGTPTGRRPPAG